MQIRYLATDYMISHNQSIQGCTEILDQIGTDQTNIPNRSTAVPQTMIKAALSLVISIGLGSLLSVKASRKT